VREGAGGSAASKESIARSDIAGHLRALLSGLGWHGPISLDAILTADGPVYIDVNPRLVEPGNAWLAGVDLVAATLALAGGSHPVSSALSREGVRSHQLLLAILGAAQSAHGRRTVTRELVRAALRENGYASSVEELTPVRDDALAAVPVVAAAAATLLWPRSWRWFVGRSIDSYALTPDGWNEILRAHRQGHR